MELDVEEAEERYRSDTVECLTAEKMFDARWAMTLLAEALNRLRQEYALQGKTSTFQALRVFLDPVNSIAPPMGTEETQIEASFCAAIRIARVQKSISLD